MAAEVMLQIGDYQFSVNSAAYQTLRRSTEYRWQGQSLIGGHDALQFTGYGADSITLSGVVFSEFRGGSGQVIAMRSQAAAGQPLLLLDGLGFIHGLYVIERIEEEQSTFARAGMHRRQQFTLQMRYYGDAATV